MAKKKKAKLSKGDLGRVQRFEKSASRSANRVARAVEIGLQTWQAKSKSSSKSKTDGMLRDAWVNGITSGSKALREAAWAPTDFFYTYDRRLQPQRIFLRA